MTLTARVASRAWRGGSRGGPLRVDGGGMPRGEGWWWGPAMSQSRRAEVCVCVATGHAISPLSVDRLALIRVLVFFD